MLANRFVYADVSTAPIEGAVDYLDAPECPGNYTKPDSIAKWHAEEAPKVLAKLVDKAALDPDLCRITGIGLGLGDASPIHFLCKTETQEREALADFAALIRQKADAPPSMLVGFNALRFDWPVLVRRAKYLGVCLPINTDRYKSPHIDLFELISHRGQSSARSLGFYVRRLGMDNIEKPLSGAEEAQIFRHERWNDLGASLDHDVEAVRRLHLWWGR